MTWRSSGFSEHMTADRFLEQTAAAMRHTFEGVEGYLDRYRHIRWPSKGRTPEELADGMRDLEEWFAGEFSLAVLCGAILQIAAQGLKICSTNSVIPASCSAFATQTTARYCVGREIHGLPVGAIVCAGRHQFAHWEDEHTHGFNKFVRGVFDHLAGVFANDPTNDMVFVLGHEFFGGVPIRALPLVLDEIGWTKYERYRVDMQDMLSGGR